MYWCAACFRRASPESTSCLFFFFFQAEDGIRDIGVTGVQTCALPIWNALRTSSAAAFVGSERRAKRRRPQNSSVKHSFEPDVARVLVTSSDKRAAIHLQIGRASCRERVENSRETERLNKIISMCSLIN